MNGKIQKYSEKIVLILMNICQFMIKLMHENKVYEEPKSAFELAKAQNEYIERVNNKGGAILIGI